MLNSCSHNDLSNKFKRKLDYLPFGYYIGIALLNLYYYFNPFSIITECSIIIYLAGSSLYVYYLQSKADSKSTNSDETYVVLVKHLENKRKNICVNACYFILATIMIDIISNLDYANVIYLFLRSFFKLLLVFHCYRQYLVYINIKTKKLF